MSVKPKIAVLLPAYNAEKYILDALNSIVEQTYDNWIVYLIEDGSTDNTYDIVKDFCNENEKFNLIKNEKNIGLIKSLNKGIQKIVDDGICTYIARMDADDLSYPERFENQVNFMNKHPHITLCSTAMKLSGTRRGVVRFPETAIGVKYAAIGHLTPVGHAAVMMKVDLFSNYGFAYHVDYPYAEDAKLWSEITKKHAAMNIQKPHYEYRFNDTNMSVVGHSAQREKAQLVIKEEYEVFLGRSLKQSESQYIFQTEIPLTDMSEFIKFYTELLYSIKKHDKDILLSREFKLLLARSMARFLNSNKKSLFISVMPYRVVMKCLKEPFKISVFECVYLIARSFSLKFFKIENAL